MVRTTLAELALLSDAHRAVLDYDAEENIATATIGGVLHYAVIPSAIDGAA
jgi:hypothetical protein